MWKPTGNSKLKGFAAIKHSKLTLFAGTNHIPLGNKRRFGDSPDGSLSPKANGTGTSVSPTTERGRDPSPKGMFRILSM